MYDMQIIEYKLVELYKTNLHIEVQYWHPKRCEESPCYVVVLGLITSGKLRFFPLGSNKFQETLTLYKMNSLTLHRINLHFVRLAQIFSDKISRRNNIVKRMHLKNANKSCWTS